MISRQPSLLSTSSQCHTHPQKIGPWKLGKTLGRGATGRVLLGVHQTTGQKAAVKVVSKSELDSGDDKNKNAGSDTLPYGIEREIIIMKLLTHPNVLRLYDVWETSKALYLVLEYVEGGELFDLLVERGPLEEQEAVKYFRQIILGTAYCHALGICHRDLKPENLLLDAGLNVKLADFGMAALESQGKLLETSCGLPHYASPEIVSGLRYHGAASDVWLCGVILFALLTGRLPFDDENIRNLLLKVQAGSFEMPHDLSLDAQDLIAHMLTVDPAERITTSAVLSHPLLTKYSVPNEDLISVRSLPHPDTAHRSLGSHKNIDPQILENLTILWSKRLQEDVIECLLSDGPNPEKTFYALLLRYRHSQEEAALYGGASSNVSGVGPSDKNRRIARLASKLSSFNTPKRVSAQSAHNRPVSFQRRYGVKSTARARDLVLSSIHDSPLKSPIRKTRMLPRKLPRKRVSRHANENPLPRNIYNDIVQASNGGTPADSLLLSIPPTLPSKDSIYAAVGTPATALSSGYMNGALSGEKSLQVAPNLVTKDKLKRMSILGLRAGGKTSELVRQTEAAGASTSTSRHLKRKSFRLSMSGLKRNSITIKLLSTYAKLSLETDWEYMDKQTKRTLATFASLCDKIFNHEAYNEEDEKMADDDEKKAREYEALMELERLKHAAEFRARRELSKQKKRHNRRSILSSRKLHITVTEDGDIAGSGDVGDVLHDNIGGLKPGLLLQPKRGSKAGPRSVSESGNPKTDLTAADLEKLKCRSATQPVPYRRQTPALSRRPVSRLDPLWIAFENKEITRAHNALEEEYVDHEKLKKEANRELMISVDAAGALKGGYSEERGNGDGAAGSDYELSPLEADNVNLSDAYMSEIWKSRLLNSQYDLKQLNVDNAKRVSVKEDRRSGNRPTLIGEVRIPKVARKSAVSSKSQKRLSLISIRSTKELYHDLNSILDAHREDLNAEELAEEEQLGTMPKLRTSFADRLDREDGLQVGALEGEAASVLDFDEHLANKRTSYYGYKPKLMLLEEKTRKAGKKTQEPLDIPAPEVADYTFSDEAYCHRASAGSVFDTIKLPTSARRSTSHRISAHQPSAVAMLVPNINKVNRIDSREGKYGTLGCSLLNLSMAASDTSNPTALAGEKENTRGINKNTKSRRSKALLTPSDDPPKAEKRSRSIFRKMSWGSKKQLENPQNLPSPAHSGQVSPELKRSGLFSRLFSVDKPRVLQYSTILPKTVIMTALYALLGLWRNFGLKDLRTDMEGSSISGTVSSSNSFRMKGSKFKIQIVAVGDQKSEIVCAHIRGSKSTSERLFKEILKVLEREGVMA